MSVDRDTVRAAIEGVLTSKFEGDGPFARTWRSMAAEMADDAADAVVVALSGDSETEPQVSLLDRRRANDLARIQMPKRPRQPKNQAIAKRRRAALSGDSEPPIADVPCMGKPGYFCPNDCVGFCKVTALSGDSAPTHGDDCGYCSGGPTKQRRKKK